MNAFAHFPSRLHWNAQQLADAVPLRLSELSGFDNARDGVRAMAANQPARRRRVAAAGRARPALHARFVVR